MFKVKYVDSIMILDLNLIVSLFQHKCEVETNTEGNANITVSFYEITERVESKF